MSRAATAGLVCLLSVAPPSWASDWNGSYAADGRCYCSGTLDARLSSRIVPTPRGGQSVGRVCQRIGPGPGLSVVDGRFDRVVYADAQCGHGPAAADADPIEPACAGTMAPGGGDCRPVGPRWDLASAYAVPARTTSVDVATELVGAGVGGTPAAVPVMGAAAAAPGAGGDEIPGRVVEIDGRRWREAPSGTPEKGPPGTRIILDGRVYLDVEKASPEDFLPRKRRSRRAEAPKTPVRPKARDAAKRTVPDTDRKTTPATAPRATAATATRTPLPETVRSRRERLLIEDAARPDAMSADGAAGSPAATAPRDTSVADATVDAEPTIGAARVAPLEGPAVAAPAEKAARNAGAATATSPDEALPERRRASALDEVADTLAADEDDEKAVSPFARALRMPPATRTSSREFGYVDAMPTSYDYGGGGMVIEGSAAIRGRFRALARLGAATDYRELLLGGSWFVTPTKADRLTAVLTAGVETGRFALERDGVSAELADSGLYLGAESRLVVNDRFELQAGVGYSSFFEGDPIAFGGSYYHVGPRLDIVSRVEVGDNDSLGIGVRYYY